MVSNFKVEYKITTVTGPKLLQTIWDTVDSLMKAQDHSILGGWWGEEGWNIVGGSMKKLCKNGEVTKWKGGETQIPPANLHGKYHNQIKKYIYIYSISLDLNKFKTKDKISDKNTQHMRNTTFF